METLSNYLNFFFNLFDWSAVLFIITAGEFLKKLLTSINLSYKINNFYKIVLYITPLYVLFVWYFGIEGEKAVLSYLLSFWLYQLFVKKLLIVVGLKN